MRASRFTGQAVVAPLVGLVAFLVAWEALVRITNTKPFVLRSPSKILAELGDSPGSYFSAALVTGREAALGLLLALAIALVVGAVLSSSRFLEEAAQPVLTLILVTPWVAYISSVVLWLGRGTRPILFVTTLVCIPAFVFATVTGLRSADPLARELLHSVDAGRIEIVWRLRLPSALPAIFAAAKFNAGLALAAAYFTEGGALVEPRSRCHRTQGRELQRGRPAVGGDLLHRHARHDRVGPDRVARALAAELAQLPTIARRRAGEPPGPRCVRVPSASMTDLSALRARIDELDHELIRVVSERLAVCEEVARFKEGSDTPVIQPARVREVVTTRRQWAIDAGVDPDFAEQFVRVLLAETHRIEVAKSRPDAAPGKSAAPDTERSGLDTVAARIDHVVVAVQNLAETMAFFVDRLGFHRQPMVGPDDARHRRDVGRRRHGRAREPGCGRERRPLPRSPWHGRAARRHRGAERRLRPGRLGGAGGATPDGGRRRRARHGAVLHRAGHEQRGAARVRLANGTSRRLQRRQRARAVRRHRRPLTHGSSGAGCVLPRTTR